MAADETNPLFVRLPRRQAELLDRAAFEGRVSKRELVSSLVQRYLEQDGGELVRGRHAFHAAEPPEVLTLEQAAALLQAQELAVAGMAECGELPARRVGGEWRFSRAALLEWLGDR